jgi:hypothetical protein
MSSNVVDTVTSMVAPILSDLSLELYAFFGSLSTLLRAVLPVSTLTKSRW